MSVENLPMIDMAVNMPTDRDHRTEGNMDETVSAPGHNNEPLFFDSDPFQADIDAEYNSDKQPDPEPKEPAWVSGFDPQFIDSFRGCVNFVDGDE